MHPMLLRQQAVEACLARFHGQPYRPGSADCARLAEAAMTAQGVKVWILKGLRWSTEAGALRALRRTGCASLLEAMDATGLERIAPARALPGDILALPSEPGCPFGCGLALALNNGRIFGFFEGEGMVLEPLAVTAAWRVAA